MTTTPSVEQVAACLKALTLPDTNTIRQAEQQLKPALKNPACMQVLWQIAADPVHHDTAVRHVAAIVLRKRLGAHYSTWDAASKDQWRQQVLQGLAAEQVRAVRGGLTGVAAAVAHVDGAASPAILQFLAAAAGDANPVARELCFLLLQEMTETVGTHWKEHVQDLVQLFTTVLSNPSEQASVHKAAVQAVGQLMSFWADEPEMEQLAPLLPTVLQVASHTGAADEDFLAVVLDVLYDLAYSPAGALQAHMELTVQFSLQIIRNRNLELRVRDAAALVIATTAEAKPKSFGRADAMLAAVLDTLFQLMQESSESAAGALFESNPAWRQDLEDDMDGDTDDVDSPTETSMAQGTLDMLACEVPKKYVWQPCLKRCLDHMSNASNPNARKAGVAGLGVIAEGCSDFLTPVLPQVLPHVFAAAQDPIAQVRECACFCLGQVSEHCQPEILQYSSQILPIIFGLLDDNSVAVQATSCYVLEMFCERLEPAAVRPLLDQLVRKLAAMLEATTKRSVQEMAVAALAATAVAAEHEFGPYVPGVATLMTKLMQVQDANLYSLRGRALECMGHIGIAVGRDLFRPYFAVTMQCAMEGINMTDSTDLQEFAYAVFANLAKVMKEEFAPALPDLVPHLIKVLEEDDGQLESTAASDSAGEFRGLDDSDDEGENGNYILHVRTALLEVKKGAITALGEMASHTGTSFCPYLERCMQILQKAATNWHPLIKTEVADAFPSLIVPSIAAYHKGEIQWTKGDTSGANPMSEHTQAIVGAVLVEEIGLLRDDEKGTVAKACEAIQSVIELCGPNAMIPVANDVLSNTHTILTKQANCQVADGMYGEMPDDDDEHDVVMQAACDLVGSFGRVMGRHFAPYLSQFLPAICEYAKSSRPPNDRSMAVGCLSEIAQELEDSIFDHWETVFRPVTLAALGDEDDNVKRNAAFCVGMCCEHLRERISGDYQTILQQLGNIFTLDASSSDATAACVDNAAAAVARMIMASPTHVPMSQVLPVFLRALPLKTDMTENETVYKCLLGLLQMNHPDAVAQKAQLKRIFTEACQEGSQVEEELRAKLQGALTALSSQ